MTPQQIRKLRDTMPGETAAAQKEVLASRICVTVYAIEEWEAGRRRPSAPCRKLLEIEFERANHD